MVRALEAGAPCCVTVSHLDALVLARSGMHHSINFRSVMAFGTAHKVEDPVAKLAALDAFVERMYPGRNAELRRPSAKELRVTTVLALPLEEAVAKVRTGPPVDDEPDYALPVWAGTIPVEMKFGKPIDDPLLAPGIAPGAALKRYRPGRG
jgi:nitroimidazol reductase NimA-like FMN-containing flavoprotein (pyridoxamine 5'-phosphate oxidase superfamily)